MAGFGDERRAVENSAKPSVVHPTVLSFGICTVLISFLIQQNIHSLSFQIAPNWGDIPSWYAGRHSCNPQWTGQAGGNRPPVISCSSAKTNTKPHFCIEGAPCSNISWGWLAEKWLFGRKKKKKMLEICLKTKQKQGKHKAVVCPGSKGCQEHHGLH